MTRHIPPDVLKEFKRLLLEGYDVKAAQNQVGISYSAARTHAKRMFPHGHPTLTASNPYDGSHPANTPDHIQRPLVREELSPVALDCLEDFGRFRARYFGRISSPWQENAAYVCKDKLLTPFKEYGVVNCPPGSGKSTLFTHDIPAWVTCRNRAIRGFLGAGTQVIANTYSGYLRSSFANQVPMQADTMLLAMHLAYDAEATLIEDYGNFNPNIPTPIGAPWTKSQFTVAQHGHVSTAQKEATWTAFGRDTGFLGWRVNFCIWDDLQLIEKLRNMDVVMADRLWFVSTAITRLEPGGLFLLQGQRLGAEDVYRFALDMPSGLEDFTEDELFEMGEELQPTERKFFHIVYKAHYEELCDGKTNPAHHSRKAKPYDPTSPRLGQCLLDPVRLPWRELVGIQKQPLSNYEVVYQQEDTDPEEVLVPQHWLDGGQYEGELFTGCWDTDRDPVTIPHGLLGTILSIVTVDPSPSKYWSIQWWIYNEPSDQQAIYDSYVDDNGKRHRIRIYPGRRYLIDQLFTPMGANDLLDWNVDLRSWTGVLVQWHERSLKLGHPYKHLIVESNAAQKFMMQYNWFQQWCNTNSVNMRPHHTSLNKLDPEYGLKTIKNHYRYGRIRLPGTREGRRVSQPLVSQVTRYPAAQYDDCIMGHWFMEFQLQHIIKNAGPRMSVYKDIPSWVHQGRVGVV